MSLLEKLAMLGRAERAAKADYQGALEGGYGKESDQEMNQKRKALRKAVLLRQLGGIAGGAALGGGLGYLASNKEGRGARAAIGAILGAGAGSAAGTVLTHRQRQALGMRTMEMKRRLGKGGYDSTADNMLYGAQGGS